MNTICCGGEKGICYQWENDLNDVRRKGSIGGTMYMSGKMG